MILGAGKALAENPSPQASQNELRTEAKITEAQARQIVLKQVPKGTIKSIELEEEKGLLIWSADVAVPATRNITEVEIDAKTGDVIALQTESLSDQKKEREMDKADSQKAENKK